MLWIGAIMVGVMGAYYCVEYLDNLIPWIRVEYFHHAGGYQLYFREYLYYTLICIALCIIMCIIAYKISEKGKVIVEPPEERKITKLKKVSHTEGFIWVETIEVYSYQYKLSENELKDDWFPCKYSTIHVKKDTDPRLVIKKENYKPSKAAVLLSLEFGRTTQSCDIYVPENFL